MSARRDHYVAVVLVAVGGAAGTLVRAAGESVLPTAATVFPLMTLAINVLGAFWLGTLVGFLNHLPTPNSHIQSNASARLRLLLGTGFCGGFTTYSTFAGETITLLHDGRAGLAFVYLALSMALGLAAMAIGLAVGRRCAPAGDAT